MKKIYLERERKDRFLDIELIRIHRTMSDNQNISSNIALFEYIEFLHNQRVQYLSLSLSLAFDIRIDYK